jgi:hypothetical protein
LIDLAPYAFRVKVATDTGQCLDYAHDVAVLLSELDRYQRSETALRNLVDATVRQAANGPWMNYQELRDRGRDAKTLQAALEAYDR